eukprot:m.9637 g.9637  ORF g.9637 m.9637 type:complete len:520 (+) comp5477_c0_seq1:196-1755(+)
MDGIGSLEIESADVVRLMLQFAKEMGLTHTFQALQQETGVAMNVVPNMDTFLSDVRHGHWETVLKTISQLKLPDAALMDLYEQIVIELVELKEYGAAKSLLRQTTPMQLLKDTESKRYLRLEDLLAKTYFDPREAYVGSSKTARRDAVATALAKSVDEAPPSRLLTLLQQAVKWQQHTGILPPGAEIDLFRGTTAVKEQEADALPTRLGKKIKFGGTSHCECATFSPDGQFFVTGSSDGLVEVYNPLNGKLRKDLKFQAEERFMMMDTSVLCMAFSLDSELFVTADKGGKMKVWKPSTGQGLRRFAHAHPQGITSVCFSNDNSQLLSASFDHTIRVHFLRSGQMVREFVGHTSFVNAAIYSHDFSSVISAGSDGTVKVWNAKSGDCLESFDRFGKGTDGSALTINTIVKHPTNPEAVLVCNRSRSLYLLNISTGKILQTYTHGKTTKGVDFTGCTISPQGTYIYAVAEDLHMYCFLTSTGKLEKTFPAHTKEIHGLAHHPHTNVLASFSDDGLVKVWRA